MTEMALAQIVVFNSPEQCLLTISELEGTVEIKHSFHTGQAIVVSAEDAILIRLRYGDRLRTTMAVGEFIAAYQDK